jgi:prepilin-type N-terminal cleavage/methylation domain-containing protein
MPRKLKQERGMSLVEIVVALTIISILTAISIPAFYHYSKTYKTEDQAVKVMDLMRETAQLALTRRRTIRFEIAWSNEPVARIIDENGAAADITLKTIPLEPIRFVRMDLPPDGVNIPNPPNYPPISIAGVWSARFRSDGSVVNGADVPISGTLFSWSPKDDPFVDTDVEPRRIQEVRAITLDGAGGAIRFWRHDGTTFVPVQ